MVTSSDKSVDVKRFLPLLLGLLSGFSVFYFLYIFGAYNIQKGLSYSGHSHLFRSISFGLLTFVHLFILESKLKPKLNLETFSRQTYWYLFLVIVGIHLIFLLFNYFWNWQELYWTSYGLICKEYPQMIVFPFVLYFFILYVTREKPDIGKEIYLSFQSVNGKDLLKTKLQDFLFANAAENYVTIHYKTNEENKQHLIRKTLKALEEEFQSFSEIARIHRSYLVNTSNVQAVKQNSGKVFLEISGQEIPVSKSFQKDFV